MGPALKHVHLVFFLRQASQATFLGFFCTTGGAGKRCIDFPPVVGRATAAAATTGASASSSSLAHSLTLSLPLPLSLLLGAGLQRLPGFFPACVCRVAPAPSTARASGGRGGWTQNVATCAGALRGGPCPFLHRPIAVLCCAGLLCVLNTAFGARGTREST